MGSRRFIEFFAKIELITTGHPAPLVPQNFELYSSIHGEPLAFDQIDRAWIFDYLDIPDSEETIRVNLSSDEDGWPLQRAETPIGVPPGVFGPIALRIAAFATRLGEPRQALWTTDVEVVPWFLPTNGRRTVKGSYFIRWNATKFGSAQRPIDLRDCVSESSVDDFYRTLPPKDFPRWPEELALPSRFLLSTSKLTDFFGFYSNGTSFQSKSMRRRQLDSLTAVTGRQLGLNCASLDRWTWNDPSTNPLHSGSLDAATVNAVADNNRIPYRLHACGSLFRQYSAISVSTGLHPHTSAMMSLWNHADALPGTSDTPIEAQRDILRKDIHASEEGYDEYSGPWSRLRLLIIGEESNFNVNAALQLFLSPAQIADLTPGSTAHAFRSVLDTPGILKQPLRPGWNRGQDLTLEYHAEFIDYIRSVSDDPAEWGVEHFDALGPIFAEAMSVSPWEQLAREGDPCALTLDRGHCTIKRKLYLHSILFVHGQVAKSSGLLARRATEVVRELAAPVTPGFHIGFGTNSFYCGAFRGDGLVFRDSFAEARQNAALVADGMNPITPWMEDNDMNGYAMPDLIGHAEYLRSAAMMSLPDADRWPTQPGPGAVGEHSLYCALITFRADETDDLLYRGLVQIGAGAKAIDFYGGVGPDIRTVTADGEGNPPEVNVWAPGPRVGHVRALTEMLRRVEDVLYPARPQRSPIAILITRCSEVWDTTTEHTAYAMERIQLATALAHAGHSLDYIDETDLLGGALLARRYLVLYLVDPNLPAAAVPLISQWVETGGTLAVLPGAAVEDEYGYPAGPELDALLGVARRGHLYAKPPQQDRRNLKIKDKGWDLTPNEPLGIKVSARNLLFHGASDTFSVYSDQWARDDRTPLWTFHPLAEGNAETLAAWVTLAPNAIAIAGLTFGESQRPLPALTRREHGQGAAFCYGIMPGAMYLGSTAYDHAAAIIGPRRYDWRPDLRLFSIAPVLMSPKGALLPAAHARIVNAAQTGAPTLLDTHGAASVRHLQSRHGVALVVANWARDPSLAPSSAFRVLVSYLLPQPDVAPVSVKSASGNPVDFRIENGYAIFTMTLFSADVITFGLRRSTSPSGSQESADSLPPLSYILCDIGKGTLSAVSANGDPLASFGGSVRQVEAHLNFLSR